MIAAGVVGAPVIPKGLRYGFGVKAFQSNVPPHLVQRRLVHASIKTTAIYGDVVGPQGAGLRRPHVEREGACETAPCAEEATRRKRRHDARLPSPAGPHEAEAKRSVAPRGL